jgi:hypothetical protein
LLIGLLRRGQHSQQGTIFDDATDVIML